MKARFWLALTLVYLVLSADAITVSSLISSMNGLREGTIDRALGPSPASNLDLETLLARMSIPKQDFISWGLGSEADFNEFVGTDEFGKPKTEMSFSQFQMYSNKVGKTPSTISVQEYPFLVRRICSTPTFYNVCIDVGPYTFVQGLAVLMFFTLGSFLIFSSLLSNWVAEPASNDLSDWVARHGHRSSPGELDDAVRRKTLVAVSVFAGSLVVLEVANMVATNYQAGSQHIADRRALLRDVRLATESDPAEFGELEPGRNLRDKQDKELSLDLGISAVATSYADEHDRKSSPFASAPNQVNQLRKSTLFASFMTALLWGIIVAVVIGIASRGMLSKSTWFSGTLGPFVGFLPLIAIITFFILGHLCRGNEPTCVAFRKRAKPMTVGLLSLFGTLLLLVRSFQKIGGPLQFDPVFGLGLPSKFDFDPTISPATVARTFSLFGVWILILLVGVLLSGNSAGRSILSKLVSRFASDGAQLFTHALVLILHFYLFWHDQFRYSSAGAVPFNILNKDIPGWADAHIHGLFELIMDVMSVYPIIYDYLTWRHSAHSSILKHVDVLIFLIVAFGIITRTRQINSQASDTKATGKKYNQVGFVISGIVLLTLMVLMTAREGKTSPTIGLFGILFLVVCIGLYVMVDLGTYGGASGDSPIADGHVISDLNLLSTTTMLFILLQKIVHLSEPNWVFPAGSTMAGNVGSIGSYRAALPLVLTFLGSVLGFGWSRMEGRPDPEFDSLSRIQNRLRNEMADVKGAVHNDDNTLSKIFRD